MRKVPCKDLTLGVQAGPRTGLSKVTISTYLGLVSVKMVHTNYSSQMRCESSILMFSEPKETHKGQKISECLNLTK